MRERIGHGIDVNVVFAGESLMCQVADLDFEACEKLARLWSHAGKCFVGASCKLVAQGETLAVACNDDEQSTITV